MGMGEGFEIFCKEHEPEANRIRLQMNQFIRERNNVKDEEFSIVKQKIYDLSVVRSTFYDGIMGRTRKDESHSQ